MNVYAIITARLRAQLAKGVVPWHRPWTQGGPPRNLLTQQLYRGVNRWTLADQYVSPYWLTFHQAHQLGGHVRAGEHGAPVIFWKFWDLTTDEANDVTVRTKRTRPLLRYYVAFNTEQCDLPTAVQAQLQIPQPHAFDLLPACEQIVAHMP